MSADGLHTGPLVLLLLDLNISSPQSPVAPDPLTAFGLTSLHNSVADCLKLHVYMNVCVCVSVYYLFYVGDSFMGAKTTSNKDRLESDSLI